MKDRQELLREISEEAENVWDMKEASVSSTGSLRYNKGKPQIHQVPKQLVEGAAEGFEYGAQKYERWNYLKGNKFSVPFDSLMRHLNKFYWEGDIDEESNIHHLKLAACNLAMLLYYIENYPEMDDRPIKEKK